MVLSDEGQMKRKMPVYSVNVKWGKEKFQNIDLDMDEPPMVFKAQLFALSGVQPDRMKVMWKGATIKDEEWGNIKLKNGLTLLMMGSAEALPEAPKEQHKFVEDMSESELANALKLPAGLTNLGNTCYINATVQCLKAIPELEDSLKKFQGSLTVSGAIVPAHSTTAALRDLYDTMDNAGSAIPPIVLLQVLHMAFPRFAEKNEDGVYQQQDANECWTEMVRMLQQKLPAVTESTEAGASSEQGFIDQFMSGQFSVSLKNIEDDEEEVTRSTEKFLQLSCFISQEVKYLHTGLKGRLSEHIEKNSVKLSRNAQYLKISEISRLPAYLTIQFVRFFFKEKENVNAKILKDVKFPLSLDVYDLCTADLQQKLAPMRTKFKQYEDKNVAMKAEEPSEQNGQHTKKTEASAEEVEYEPYSFPEDAGSNNSGYYELSAVLTHRGRSSSSGHYVAWVRRKNDEWVMCDDDNVYPVMSEDILKLSGGGDWHCAYILLYSPRQLPVDKPTEPSTPATESAATATAETMES